MNRKLQAYGLGICLLGLAVYTLRFNRVSFDEVSQVETVKSHSSQQLDHRIKIPRPEQLGNNAIELAKETGMQLSIEFGPDKAEVWQILMNAGVKAIAIDPSTKQYSGIDKDELYSKYSPLLRLTDENELLNISNDYIAAYIIPKKLDAMTFYRLFGAIGLTHKQLADVYIEAEYILDKSKVLSLRITSVNGHKLDGKTLVKVI